jgi:hypothetical protein
MLPTASLKTGKSKMNGYQQDIEKIKEWMKRNDRGPTRLSMSSTKRTNTVRGILKGRCTIKTLQRVLTYVNRHPQLYRK